MFRCFLHKLKATFVLGILLSLILSVPVTQGAEPLSDLNMTGLKKTQLKKDLEIKEPTLRNNRASSQTKNISRMPKRLRGTFFREKLSFSSGINFSQGEYSSEVEGVDKNTDISSIPFRIKYGQKDWSMSAQIPYIYITGPASVISVGDGIESDFNISEVERKRWGFGDLRLGAQYKLPAKRISDPRLHFGTRIKVPTASEKDDLGSGEIDYSFYTGGYVRTGRWVSNARLGYQLMGDTETTNYNNRWYASIGGNYVMSKQYSAGLNYYFKQASSSQSEAVRNLSTSFNWRLPQGWRLGFSIGTGFSRSSADISSGINITKTLSESDELSFNLC